MYRLLVSHENVPLWRAQSCAGLANHQHLYTRHLAAGEADVIENWLARDFEDPAEPVIEKVISGARMYPPDWQCLARFVAAQDVRTPARMMEMIKRWQKSLPDLVQGGGHRGRGVLGLEDDQRLGVVEHEEPAVTAHVDV